MKHLITILVILISATALGQSKYEQGMTKAFELMEQNKMDEASNLFQRIATAEKENWLPYYYVAQVEILKVWQHWEERDETMLKAQTAKAQEYINTANLREMTLRQARAHWAHLVGSAGWTTVSPSESENE